MPPEQKQSVFIVLVCAVSVMLYAVLTLVGMKHAPVAFGVMFIAGLAPLLFPRKHKRGEVAWDERDEVIVKKATRGGAMCSYGIFIAGCMVPWTIYKEMGKEVISIHVLPWIAGAGIIVFFVARAIVILILYGREKGNSKEAAGKEAN